MRASKYILLLPLVALLTGLPAGCATSPTGHREVLLYSQPTMNRLGTQAYAQARRQNTISHNKKINDFVNCVAGHIIQVVKDRGGEQYDWQVTVFKKDEANAFALPGGKVAVYTGILKYARNQAQLAAVLGHETGHVLAHHPNARMSAAQLTQVGTSVLAAVLGEHTGMSQRALMTLLGVGSQVGVLLPYSRSQESEADLIGLYNMARAGFDPRQAVVLWKHFNKGEQGQPPAFLSTHPGSGQRIQDLRNHMGQAMDYYHAARAQGRNPQCGPAPPPPS